MTWTPVTGDGTIANPQPPTPTPWTGQSYANTLAWFQDQYPAGTFDANTFLIGWRVDPTSGAFAPISIDSAQIVADVTSGANSAAASAAAALASQNAAATSATNAATSATAANSSATLAQAWAAQPSGVVNGTTWYSAFYYATQANTSATNAASSATTATTQAGIATTQASNASTSATNAAGSATAAATSATNASTSAANAANSATAAANSAASISLPIPVASGGTGSTTASAARTALGAAGLADANVFTNAKNTFSNVVQLGTYSQLVEISGDFYEASNAYYDGTNWQRVDTTKVSWLFQVNVTNNMPFEGYKGLTTWVCQPGSNPIGNWGAANGWTLIQSYSQYHDVTLGGNGFEIDGNGTVPYGRLQHATVGALKKTGVMTNAYLDESGRDDTTKNSWWFGIADDGSTSGDVWKIRRAPSGASLVWADLMTVSSSGAATFAGNVTLNGATPIAVWQDSAQTGGAGIYRIRSTGGVWNFQRNTAAAGDFSTLTTPMQFAANDIIAFSQRPTFAGNTAIDTGNIAANAQGRLINVQVFVSSGTYTPTAGTNSIIVDVQGAGGGGGGSPATGAGQVSCGAPGGSGGYAQSRMTSGFSGTSVVVGAAGAAGGAGTAGGNGGNSSFGSTVGGGGTGGTVGGPNSTATAAGSGAGGTATGGNIINVYGSSLSSSWCAQSLGVVLPGSANAAPYGGNTYGYGAAGRGAGSSTGALTGFSGGNGIVVVREYA